MSIDRSVLLQFLCGGRRFCDKNSGLCFAGHVDKNAILVLTKIISRVLIMGVYYRLFRLITGE